MFSQQETIVGYEAGQCAMVDNCYLLTRPRSRGGILSRPFSRDLLLPSMLWRTRERASQNPFGWPSIMSCTNTAWGRRQLSHLGNTCCTHRPDCGQSLVDSHADLLLSILALCYHNCGVLGYFAQCFAQCYPFMMIPVFTVGARKTCEQKSS